MEIDITEKLNLEEECTSTKKFLFRERISEKSKKCYCKASVYFPYIERCQKFCEYQGDTLSRKNGDGSKFYECKYVPKKNNCQG